MGEILERWKSLSEAFDQCLQAVRAQSIILSSWFVRMRGYPFKAGRHLISNTYRFELSPLSRSG